MVLVGALDDLVVDVGNVAYVGDVIASFAEVSDNHVEDHHDPGMAKVAVIVDRHPADIHADLARLYGFEGVLAAGQCIEDFQHRVFSRLCPGRGGFSARAAVTVFALTAGLLSPPAQARPWERKAGPATKHDRYTPGL